MQHDMRTRPSRSDGPARTGKAGLGHVNVVLIVADSALGNIVANHFSRAFPNLVVLRERPEAKSTVLRRRARLLGPLQAAGQAISGLVFRALARASRKRITDICAANALDPSPPRTIDMRDIGSVNSQTCRTALRQLKPAAIAVYGTRIIGRRTLDCTPAPFINYHAGINPKYRGQHPGYWARANRDPQHTGITIHLVDRGVDTGDVLAQKQVHLGAPDNIATYQYVQMAAALEPFTNCLKEAVAGTLQPRQVDLASSLYFPPAIWTYAWNGLRRGVW